MGKSAETETVELEYDELRVESWKELYSVLKEYATDDWLFRGQRDAAWQLSTSIERCYEDVVKLRNPDPPSISRVEKVLINQFKSQAHQFLPHELIPSSVSGWIALMQQHGAPTRLLDWTQSQHMAAYFALEECHETKAGHAAVWAIDGDWLIRRAADTLVKSGEIPGGAVEYDTSMDKVLPRMLKSNAHLGVFPFESLHPPLRYSAQLGYYLLVGNLEQGFRKNLQAFAGNELKGRLHKIVIPSTLQAKGLYELHLMGISRDRLFSDIDGFATSLRIRLAYDSYRRNMQDEKIRTMKTGIDLGKKRDALESKRRAKNGE